MSMQVTVIPKIGNSCPSGYSTSGSGKYCLAHKKDAKVVMPKSGSCPSGFSTSGSGKYCLSIK